MVIVTCSVPDCKFQSDDISEAMAIALPTNHGLAHQTPATPPQNTALRGPKLERPKVEIGISTEEWNIFNRRWEVFRAGSGIDDSSAPSHVIQCAGNELGDNLLKANPNSTNETLFQLMAAMRSLAVIPVATAPNFCSYAKSVTSQPEHSRPRSEGRQKHAPSPPSALADHRQTTQTMLSVMSS